MFDLNSLVTNLGGAGFSYLDVANSINDSGWITGSGVTLGMETHAFIAVPVAVPEPATFAVGLRCIGAAVGGRRRGARSGT